MSMAETVDAALTSATLRPCDAAAAQLAVTYAKWIDEGEDLVKVGPLLLSALESLGMTPKGRKALAKGGAEDGQQGRSPLDELRERRQARTG